MGGATSFSRRPTINLARSTNHLLQTEAAGVRRHPRPAAKTG
nr:MAG TPA: hypothetical protein [Caudoviricetes sp.]